MNCFHLTSYEKMKIVSYYIIIICFLIISCKNDGQRKIASQRNDTMNRQIQNENHQFKEDILLTQDGKGIVSENKNISIEVSIENISFEGIKFKDAKSRMTNIMGIPDSIIEPKYECGPFSEDWQRIKFYQYYFDNMNFIVYQNKAEIQEIKFLDSEKLKINGQAIDKEMNFVEVATKLGIILEGKYNEENILIYPKEALDEHYILIFKENKLYQFDRFEPC